MRWPVPSAPLGRGRLRDDHASGVTPGCTPGPFRTDLQARGCRGRRILRQPPGPPAPLARRRDQLLLVGGWLESNVHSTLRSANDRGYECLLVLDACTPYDAAMVAASRSQVEMSGGIFGAVGETAHVLAALAALLPRKEPGMTTLPTLFGPVAAEPYTWPYNGSFAAATTALVNIDWQVDFCGPGGYVDWPGYDLSPTRSGLPATAWVLAAAREVGMFVVHTPRGPPTRPLGLPNKLWRSGRSGRGSGRTAPAADPHPRRAGDRARGRPIEGELVIDKPGKGSFYATDLDLLLRTRG